MITEEDQDFVVGLSPQVNSTISEDATWLLIGLPRVDRPYDTVSIVEFSLPLN